MPGGYAYVTLATSDTYSLGALVLAHSLKRVNTPHNLVIMITPGISASMRQLLENAYNEVIEVDILDSKDEANLRLLKRPELGVTFTKLHCWKLINYNKCVFLDADTLVLQNVDDLFERDELSAAPDVGWPDCFNSGVFVFKPSMDTFNDLIKFAIEHGSFDGGDQGLLNMYFSNWGIADIRKHLPFVYNLCSAALYSYLPAFKWFGQNIKIVHFISGSKPWLQSFNPQTRTVQPPIDSPHLKDLLQLWWDIFCVHVHPGLSTEMSGLANAYANVRLDEPSQEQLLLQDQFRRQNWEQGNIDYMGRDAFDNIWAKIQQTIGSNEQEQPPSKSDDDKKSSSVIKDDASTVVTTNQTIKEPTGAKETVSNLEKKTVEISQGKKIEEPSKSSVTQDKPLSKDEAIVKPPTKVSDEAVEKPKETNNELEKKIAAETIKLQEVKPAVETIKDVDKYLSDLEKTTENLQHLDIIEKPALIDESKLKPATRLGSEAVNVVLPEVIPSPVVKPPSDTPLSVEPFAQIPEQKKLKVGVPPSLVQSSVPFAPVVVSSAPRVEQPTIPPLSPTSVKHEAVILQSGKEQESSHKSSSSGKDEIAAPVSPVKSPPISVLTKEDVAIKLSSSDKESDKQPKTAAPPPAKQIKSPLPLDSPTTESKPLGTPSIESPKISQPTGSQQQQKQQQQSGKSKDSGKPSAAASSGKKK